MGSLKLPNMIDITARVDDWSTDPPTEDGWYWCYAEAGVYQSARLQLHNVDANEQRARRGDKPMSDFTHFLGPLPKPEPPR